MSEDVATCSHEAETVGSKRPTALDVGQAPGTKRRRHDLRVLTAEAHGLRGKRPTMEDAHAVHLDLHAVAYQMVVPLEGGGKTNHLSSDLASRVDANLLGGLNRKAAVRFARRLEMVREHFFGPSPDRPPPRMAFLGVYDGHCGPRAAGFCKKWLHLYVYFAMWKLHYEALDAGTSSSSTPAAGPDNAKADDSILEGPPKHLFARASRKDIERVLIEAFQELDEAFLEEAEVNNWNDGCTALCCLVVENDLFCMSVGDSQGVIAIDKGGSMVHGVISGMPHKPTDKREAKRIKDSKGFIQDGRLWGVLGVSRSIGDRKYKKAGVLPTPNIMKIDLFPALFVVLACDGLWDVFPVQTVTQLVQKMLQEGETVKDVAQHLVKEAINGRNSHDNVTVVLATFT